jgi:hypothetical protein
MKYEKPQKGNPHKLTVNQHAFPARSISRFVDSSGRVETRLIRNKKTVKLKPSDQVFCAKRVWNQRAESGYMRSIEDKYQALATAIIDGRLTHISPLENHKVTEMFALWNLRTHRKENPIKDEKINGIDVAVKLTKYQQESLESKHITTIGPDLTIAGRDLAGITIQMDIDRICEQMSDTKWGILTSAEGEFIVPDNFSNARILPLTPRKCLFSQSENNIIGKNEVAKINQLALETCREYWFSRDMRMCPI